MLAGYAPGRTVLAPLCGAFASIVSRTDRHRLLLAPSCLQSLELALAGCTPGRTVLAPLCGAFTSDRQPDGPAQIATCTQLFAKSGAGAGWLCPRSNGPRAALRCLHFDRQPDGPAQTRVLRGWAFRLRPCRRILASSLRSALRIVRPGAQPACFLTSVLLEKEIQSSFFVQRCGLPIQRNNQTVS